MPAAPAAATPVNAYSSPWTTVPTAPEAATPDKAKDLAATSSVPTAPDPDTPSTAEDGLGVTDPKSPEASTPDRGTPTPLIRPAASTPVKAIERSAPIDPAAPDAVACAGCDPLAPSS